MRTEITIMYLFSRPPQGKLDLDSRVEKILMEYPVSGSTNIRDCTQAAYTLQTAISEELSPGVQILQAVTERKHFFSTLSFRFGHRLMETLKGTFAERVGGQIPQESFLAL